MTVHFVDSSNVTKKIKLWVILAVRIPAARFSGSENNFGSFMLSQGSKTKLMGLSSCVFMPRAQEDRLQINLRIRDR